MLNLEPMETSPEHRTGLWILAATEIAIMESPQGNKNKRTQVSFCNPGEAAAAEIWEQGQQEAPGVRGCWISCISSSFTLAFFLRLR